ncbi:hypothetical protein AB0C88_42105 [Streptomyces chartreusis]|uniref:hypothetical protein n=1 Tax=Streptomyces chartreusis TaxID=1969 RepID=UPI0033D4F924
MGDGGLDDPLRSAVRARNAEAVRDPLDKGADPNTPDAADPVDDPNFEDDQPASGLWWWERRQANPDGE